MGSSPTTVKCFRYRDMAPDQADIPCLRDQSWASPPQGCKTSHFSTMSVTRVWCFVLRTKPVDGKLLHGAAACFASPPTAQREPPPPSQGSTHCWTLRLFLNRLLPNVPKLQLQEKNGSPYWDQSSLHTQSLSAQLLPVPLTPNNSCDFPSFTSPPAPAQIRGCGWTSDRTGEGLCLLLRSPFAALPLLDNLVRLPSPPTPLRTHSWCQCITTSHPHPFLARSPAWADARSCQAAGPPLTGSRAVTVAQDNPTQPQPLHPFDTKLQPPHSQHGAKTQRKTSARPTPSPSARVGKPWRGPADPQPPTAPAAPVPCASHRRCFPPAAAELPASPRPSRPGAAPLPRPGPTEPPQPGAPLPSCWRFPFSQQFPPPPVWPRWTSMSGSCRKRIHRMDVNFLFVFLNFLQNQLRAYFARNPREDGHGREARVPRPELSCWGVWISPTKQTEVGIRKITTV